MVFPSNGSSGMNEDLKSQLNFPVELGKQTEHFRAIDAESFITSSEVFHSPILQVSINQGAANDLPPKRRRNEHETFQQF